MELTDKVIAFEKEVKEEFKKVREEVREEFKEVRDEFRKQNDKIITLDKKLDILLATSKASSVIDFNEKKYN